MPTTDYSACFLCWPANTSMPSGQTAHGLEPATAHKLRVSLRQWEALEERLSAVVIAVVMEGGQRNHNTKPSETKFH